MNEAKKDNRDIRKLFRFNSTESTMLELLANDLGVTESEALRYAIRKMAENRGLVSDFKSRVRHSHEVANISITC
jgi:hypothetical protein